MRYKTLVLRGVEGEARLANHSRGHGGIGGLVDEDEAASDSVAGVVVAGQWCAHLQAHPADLVQTQRLCVGLSRERCNAEPGVDTGDYRFGGTGGVLDAIDVAPAQGAALSIQQTTASSAWVVPGGSLYRDLPPESPQFGMCAPTKLDKSRTFMLAFVPTLPLPGSRYRAGLQY